MTWLRAFVAATLLTSCMSAQDRRITFADSDAAFIDTTNAVAPIAPEEGRLVRITRDYNNDGRPDRAYAFGDMCGAGSFSTGCEWSLYVRTEHGGYAYAGLIAPHGEKAPLVPLQRGSARLLNCIAHRDGSITLWTQIISDHVLNEPNTAISPTEESERCGADAPAPNYVSEVCDASAFLVTRQCAWLPIAW